MRGYIVKKKCLLLCIICFVISFLSTVKQKQQQISFITDVTISTQNHAIVLQNRDYDSIVYELNEKNNIENMFVVKPEGDTKVVSKQIVKDNNQNTYILLQQQMETQTEKQYVAEYDENGTFQQQLFLCDNNQMGHENHILKNLQYSEKQNTIISFLIEDKRTIQAMFYDTVSKNSWTKTYHLEKDYDIQEILYDGNGGIYFTTILSELYFIDTQYELCQITLPRHCVPYKLSIDEQKQELYFNDIHHFSFVKYNRNENVFQTIYEEYDSMVGDIPFYKIRDLKYEKGYFLASTPLYELEKGFYYIGTQQQGQAVYEMTKTTPMLIQYGIKCFVVLLFCFGFVLLLWYIWKYSQKLLIRLIMIMTILLFVGASGIGVALYKEILEEMKDEVYMQLYSMSELIANNIDGDDLEKAVFPQKEGDTYYDTLVKKMYLDMNAFYEQNANAMKKRMYYTLYFAEGENFYVGIDSMHSEQEEELSNTSERYIVSQQEINIKRENWKQGKAALLLTPDMTTQWLSSTSPIYNSKGKLVGAIDVGVNQSDVVEYMANILIKTVMVVLLVAMILIIVTAVFLKQYLKGIGNLKKCVDAITEGNWNVIAQIHTNDELEQIGNAFNRMVYRIKSFLDTILQMNTACERFLPTALFEKMGKENITALELGDQIMIGIYLLTIKISNFYDITKDMTTEQKFEQINDMLALLSGIIGESNGIIESYQGAGMRVIYTENAEDGINTALKIAEKVEWYQHKTNKNVQLTMTLQYNDTMLGVVGDERHMSISMVSEGIDFIYDMERYAEQNGIILLFTENVLQNIQKKQNYHIRELYLSAKNNTLLFDCVDAYPSYEKECKKKTIASFIKAIQCCNNQDFEEARKHFIVCMDIAPNDIVTKKHIFYCDKMIENKNKIVLPKRKLVK